MKQVFEEYGEAVLASVAGAFVIGLTTALLLSDSGTLSTEIFHFVARFF